VICRQLGFTGGYASAVPNSAYGPGSGPTWLTKLECSGGEDWLSQCDGGQAGAAVQGCAHSHDAAVACSFSTDTYSALPGLAHA
jgi:hypothetical protein